MGFLQYQQTFKKVYTAAKNCDKILTENSVTTVKGVYLYEETL